MSQFCVPFLIVNYGSEMIFILEQRLTAQNVRGDKRNRVLQDVCHAVFSPSFVSELLRPQLLYSQAATKEIFEKLAHSSIMRLSSNSMEKLYDLMTMACKYHLVACRVPRDLVKGTLVHLENVTASVRPTDETTTALSSTLSATRELGNTLTDGQLADARYALLNFFHGKRLKISLLIQEGLQNKDGTFSLPPCAIPPEDRPAGALPLGTVQYFDDTGCSVARCENVAHPLAGIENQPIPESRLGRNLYMRERSKAAPSPQPAAASSPGNKASPAGRHAYAPAATNNAPSAINTLSALIVNRAGKEAVSLNIQNLFDEAAAGGAAAPAAAGGGDVLHIGQVTREEAERANSDLVSVMSSFSAPGRPAAAAGGAAAGGNDDLLDLLDGV